MRLLAGLLVAASLMALVVACGGDSDTPAGTAAAGNTTAAPSATRAVENVTAVAEPTATATRTPAPTATSAATETPTVMPEPPTATPEPPTATPVPPTATALPLPPAPPPTQAPSGGAQSLFLTAKSLKFSPTTLYATAGGSVTIALNNQDNFVPHNVSVTGLGTSETCQGPCTATLYFLTPAPGSYGFLCTVHPYMTGTLVVQ